MELPLAATLAKARSEALGERGAVMDDTFHQHRERLFAIAYRMTGSRADADELVSECWLRWAAADQSAVENVGAWLSTVMVRLAIDLQKSARARREQYVGPWLPEPIVTELGDTPAERAAVAESISSAFLLVLEALTPVERAVLLLHDVFDYEHDEIAVMLDRSTESCRQSLHRARESLRARRPKFAPTRERHVAVLAAFSQAVATGDMSALLALLSPEASFVSDSGGKARAARRVVTGADHCARLLLGLAKKDPEAASGARLIELNGWPAIVIEVDGRIDSTLSIETDGERIFSVHSTRNPEKLASLAL